MADVAQIISKVNEYGQMINDLYENTMNIINKCIEEYDEIKNNAMEKSMAWIQVKTKKITDKINNCVAAFKEKIQNIMSALETWYENVIKNIKFNMAKAMLAKIGQDAPDDVVETTAESIPFPAPPLTSLIPIPEIEISQLMHL